MGDHLFAPSSATDATRQLYDADPNAWPIVSTYRTLSAINKRLEQLKKLPKTQRRVNEKNLLFTKRLLVRPVDQLGDAGSKMMAFARFLWGSDLAVAETADERKEARKEETILLMEIWLWLRAGMAAVLESEETH